MSVMMTMKVAGDTEAFRGFLANNAEMIAGISEESRAKGCLHHRFAIGDGYVLVIDEWESIEAFMGFFEGNEKIEVVMRDSGARGEPEISFGETIDAPGQF